MPAIHGSRIRDGRVENTVNGFLGFLRTGGDAFPRQPGFRQRARGRGAARLARFLAHNAFHSAAALTAGKAGKHAVDDVVNHGDEQVQQQNIFRGDDGAVRGHDF